MRSITTWVEAAPPRMVICADGLTAVVTLLARFWPAPNQLMLELPGHGTLAGKTATNPPDPSVSVTVRLITAPRTPGRPRARVRCSPSVSLPPEVRVSRTRGELPVKGTKAWAGGW